jgi:hypothetical protein
MAAIKKRTVKDLLESYAAHRAKFTPIQFITLLRVLAKKADGSTSTYVQAILAPIYLELSANRLPHHGLVLVVLAKLNRPFFRRKKNLGGEEVEEMPKTPGIRVKASNFMDNKSPASRDAELRKKLKEEWLRKTAESYRVDDSTSNIKSAGNGL